MLSKQNITKLFKIFKTQNPDPQTELVYHTPFELLIAVLLSAQATDISVNKATKTLYPIANTPQGLLDLGEEGIKAHIRHIGLFNSKAKHIIATCQQLLKQYDGKVPLNREALEKLPGVGRKTANVVLNVWLEAPTMPVDTHVFRVAKRLGLAHGNTPLAVEKELLKNIPKAYLSKAHHWLILHGRYICQARKPRCGTCPVQQLCLHPNKT